MHDLLVMPVLRAPLHRVCIASASVQGRRGSLWWQRRGKDRIRCAAASEESPPVSPNRQGEATSDFTPFTMVSYSEEPENVCQHREEIVVDASREYCFDLWNKWDNLLDFLDLITEIFLDKEKPHAAIMLCNYRYERLPILQILTEVHKTEIQSPSFIKFESMSGMPLGGIVEFEEVERNQTRVTLRFENAMPMQLLFVKVGVYGVENHIKNILEQNLATFKMLAEGKLQFSDEKYNQARALQDMEEMRRALEESEWLSEEEPFQISNFEDYMQSLDESDLFPEDDDGRGSETLL